jgi:hypothetical protein
MEKIQKYFKETPKKTKIVYSVALGLGIGALGYYFYRRSTYNPLLNQDNSYENENIYLTQ